MRAKETAYLKNLSVASSSFSKKKMRPITLLENYSITGETNDVEFIKKLHDLLLYIIAYPHSTKERAIAEKHLKKIASKIKLNKSIQTDLINSGLPHAPSFTTFSHDMVKWLVNNSDVKVIPEISEANSKGLSDALGALLPRYISEFAYAGYSNEDLLEMFSRPKDHLSFIVSIFDEIKMPFVKDLLFESLDIYYDIIPSNRTYSISYNRIPVTSIFYHDTILKYFSYLDLISQPLPHQKNISNKLRVQIDNVVKSSMTLLARETDTATYMDPKSIQFYELDRGISVALYDMVPSRQLSFESYVGYSLFKNGFPCAYGGAWVFGNQAKIGINIFEQFRGGESGYVFCQLIRLYKQLFKIDEFEVEPYQFGLDNPDGIKSGSFWFYYRYGFKPVDKDLARLASEEKKKRAKDPAHRTSEHVLLKFTKCNMRLTLNKSSHMRIEELNDRVRKLVRNRFRGNRSEAVIFGKKIFRSKLPGMHIPSSVSMDENILFALVKNIASKKLLKILVEMSRSKSNDLLKYQQSLREFLEKTSV